MLKVDKKVLAILLVLVMTLTSGLTAFAASDIVAEENVTVITGDSTIKPVSTVRYGNYLYAACVNGGLQIYDVSDLTNIRNVTPTSDTNLQGRTMVSRNAVCEKDGFLYVAFQYVIRKFSLSNPAAPVLEATFNAASSDMEIVGNYLFAGTSGNRGRFYDMSTSASTPTAERNRNSLFITDGITSLAVNGSTLYATLGTELYAVDISSPSSMTQTNTIENGEYSLGVLEVANGNLTDLQVVNGYLYCNDKGNKKIYRIDISSPANITNPEKRTEVYTGEVAANNFIVDNDYLYIEASDNIAIYDLTISAYPKKADIALGSSFSENEVSLCKNGEYIYLADVANAYIASVKELSLTMDTMSDIIVSTGEPNSYVDGTGNRFTSVAYYDKYLYVMTEAGLKIFDLTNPGAPADVTPSTNTDLAGKGPTIARDAVIVRNGYLYCAYLTEPTTIKKFSLANPANPALVATFKSNNNNQIFSMDVVGDYLIAAGRNAAGMSVWKNDNTTTGDVSQQENMITGQANAYSMEIIGENIFTLNDAGNVYVNSLSESTAVKTMGNLTYKAGAMTYSNGYLYLCGAGAITIIPELTSNLDNLVDTSKHIIAYTNETFTTIKQCFIEENYLYAFGAQGNLWVFDISDPCRPILKSNNTSLSAYAGAVRNGYVYATDYSKTSKTDTKLNTIAVNKGRTVNNDNSITTLPAVFKGKASGTQTVNVTVDDGATQSVAVAADGSWEISIPVLSGGEHTVKAIIPDTDLTVEKTVTMAGNYVSFKLSDYSLKAGASITANGVMSYVPAGCTDVWCVLSIYYDNTLSDVKIIKKNVTDSSEVVVSSNISVPNVNADVLKHYSVKAFLWTDKLVPLYRNLILD